MQAFEQAGYLLRNRFYAAINPLRAAWREQTATAAANPAPPPATEPDQDDTCRICFGTRDSDSEQGRLFSPCLCRGTQRFVHTGCLEAWRQAAVNQRSFYECDQCRYKYRIGRTKIAGLATNKYALYTLTALLFIILVFFAGFASSLLLYFTDRLPTAPWFEDISWYFGLSNPLASPFDYGDVLGGMTERSLDIFAGSSRGAQSTRQSLVHRSLYALGFVGPNYKETWSFKAMAHMLVGFSTIGILSFLQMAISYSLLAPLHHLRVFRRGQGNRANERNSDFGSILVFLFVLAGTAKAIYSLYFLVKRLSRYALTRFESGILEVNG